MEYQQFFQDHMEIEQLCAELLCNDPAVEKLAQKLLREPDWLEENGTGRVPEKALLSLLKRGYQNPSYEPILMALINYVNGEEVTPNVFAEILQYPNKNLRDYFITALSHKSLPIDQLRALCAQNVTFECYFQLAEKYCLSKGDAAREIDALLLQLRASPFAPMEGDLLSELQQFARSLPKKEMKSDLIK